VRLLRRLTAAGLALLLAAVVLASSIGGRAAGSGLEARVGPVVEHGLRLVSTTRAERIKDALGTARRQKGDPYKYGAEGPDRFDCSGLVYYATHKAGFDKVPRTSAEQGRFMRHIKKKNLRRGDFLFFTGSSGVYHVGIYVGRRDGDRAILHAPKPHTRVRVEKVWTSSWFAGTLRK
jgi:cell wall-associated NlpC family hydrolase